VYNFGLKWINLVTRCAPFAQSGQKRRAQIGDFLKNKHPCALWCITVRTEAPEKLTRLPSKTEENRLPDMQEFSKIALCKYRLSGALWSMIATQIQPLPTPHRW